MKGSPLLRALLAFLVILSLGWPLKRLTTAATAPREQPGAVAAVVKKEIYLQLTFTLLPKSLKVLHLGEVVWSELAPTAEMEHAITIPYPEEGVDLQFQVEWPPGGVLSAMRVRLTDPAGELHEKTVWGKGSVEEVVTFP